jgi:hypothetical protein
MLPEVAVHLPVVVPLRRHLGGTATQFCCRRHWLEWKRITNGGYGVLTFEALLPLLVGGLKAASVPCSSTLLLLQKSLAPHSVTSFINPIQELRHYYVTLIFQHRPTVLAVRSPQRLFMLISERRAWEPKCLHRLEPECGGALQLWCLHS